MASTRVEGRQHLEVISRR